MIGFCVCFIFRGLDCPVIKSTQPTMKTIKRIGESIAAVSLLRFFLLVILTIERAQCCNLIT